MTPAPRFTPRPRNDRDPAALEERWPSLQASFLDLLAECSMIVERVLRDRRARAERVQRGPQPHLPSSRSGHHPLRRPARSHPRGPGGTTSVGPVTRGRPKDPQHPVARLPEGAEGDRLGRNRASHPRGDPGAHRQTPPGVPRIRTARLSSGARRPSWLAPGPRRRNPCSPRKPS